MADHEVARADVRPRHLVVLIDGTWVSPIHKPMGMQQSNVFWLNLFLESQNLAGEAQIAFYHPGIGAVAANTEKWLGGGLALGLERLVEAAYLDIVSNYHAAEDKAKAVDLQNGSRKLEAESDKIYLIGFSRGAVIASVVASLISKFGVLNPLYVQHYPDLWKHASGEGADTDVEAIKRNCCREAKVEFLGLFDTVPGAWIEGSSPESRVIRDIFFQNRKLPRNIKRALHILSMNETRSAFRPVEFEGVEDADGQTLEQIWMPGVHSDIGGGYAEDLLSNVALITMIDRLKTNLKLDNGRLNDLNDKIKVTFPHKDDIYVHDEFGRSVFSRLLWLSIRLFVKMRINPANGSNNRYHEFCGRIEGRFIRMKSHQDYVLFQMDHYRRKGWPQMSFAEVELLGECLGPLPAPKSSVEGSTGGPRIREE